MLPPTNPLIAAVVEPLADNAEHQLAAIAILSETADPSHPATAETIARLDRIRARKFPALRPAILGLAVAIAIGAIVSVQFAGFSLGILPERGRRHGVEETGLYGTFQLLIHRFSRDRVDFRSELQKLLARQPARFPN